MRGGCYCSDIEGEGSRLAASSVDSPQIIGGDRSAVHVRDHDGTSQIRRINQNHLDAHNPFHEFLPTATFTSISNPRPAVGFSCWRLHASPLTGIATLQPIGGSVHRVRHTLKIVTVEAFGRDAMCDVCERTTCAAHLESPPYRPQRVGMAR